MKWEHVTMNFVTHLPRTRWRHDAIWVIMDQLTKSAHFLAVQMTFTQEELCWLYIREIVRLHGVLVSIVWDRDLRFTCGVPLKGTVTAGPNCPFLSPP